MNTGWLIKLLRAREYVSFIKYVSFLLKMKIVTARADGPLVTIYI